jgi:hypothetical protein
MMSEICGTTPEERGRCGRRSRRRARGDDALLDAGAAGVVEADDRDADLHGPVHDLDDLLAEDLAERAAEDGEVLGEHAIWRPSTCAVAGDDAIAVGPVLLLPEGCSGGGRTCPSQ